MSQKYITGRRASQRKVTKLWGTCAYLHQMRSFYLQLCIARKAARRCWRTNDDYRGSFSACTKWAKKTLMYSHLITLKINCGAEARLLALLTHTPTRTLKKLPNLREGDSNRKNLEYKSSDCDEISDWSKRTMISGGGTSAGYNFVKEIDWRILDSSVNISEWSDTKN